MTRRNILLGLLAVMMLALFFVYRSKSDDLQWREATSQRFNFTLSYPGSWQPSEDQTFFTLVDTKSSSKVFRSYIRFGAAEIITKEDFEKVLELGENTDISNYFQSTELTKRTVVKIKNTTVDGAEAFEVHEDTIMPGPYWSEAVYALRGDKIYVFRLTAESPEELEREKSVYYQIILTVDFL